MRIINQYRSKEQSKGQVEEIREIMNHFVSFCFNIGRIHPIVLLKAAQGLINSLNEFENNYAFTIYTNMKELHTLPLASQSNITIIDMGLEAIPKEYGGNVWHNLSTYKFTVIKQLTESTGIVPIWVDLDTTVCRNIDHLVNYDNFFIMQGTGTTSPFPIFKDIAVPSNIYIQGNIWKLNKELIEYFDEIWNSFTDQKPDYDLQGMFNYAYHFKQMNTKMMILGKDMDADTVNGLDVVNYATLQHPNIADMKDTIISTSEGIVQKTTNRKIQFFSFTFLTLQRFILNGIFHQLNDPCVRDFFLRCYDK